METRPTNTRLVRQTSMQQNRDGLAPWTVLILPYVEESARYKTFNFLAGFNGLIPGSSATVSGNRGPQSVPNSKYQCPSDPNSKPDVPNNERRRLQLHFSKNTIDWCFAGLVAVGPSEHASRHYASMAVDGDDLVILSRSGDQRAKSAHDGNLITFHRVKHFRELVY